MLAGLQWIVWCGLYLVGHFALYTLVLRNRESFLRERVIFGYHVLSAVALALVLLGTAVITAREEVLIETVGALSLHGIYSLSFLELWSLSEAGYSLRILGELDTPGGAPKVDLALLYRLGSSKKESRIESLQRLRLVRRQTQGVSLTPLGRVLAAALRAIAKAVNVKM